MFLKKKMFKFFGWFLFHFKEEGFRPLVEISLLLFAVVVVAPPRSRVVASMCRARLPRP